ncbi:MAG: methylenetetrahydrofolate reductase [Candidatus Omnitrophota bacterium]
MKSTFCDKVRSGAFLVTSEVGPPKGTDLAGLVASAEFFRGRVDAINVTDIQNAVMRLGSLAASVCLKQNGHEPIYQLTCRDRNRLALQSDILSAAYLGIKNILVVTGDHPSAGDHPQTKPVFDLNSVQLLDALRGLQEGHDMTGHRLDGTAPRFCVGAVVNPGADPLEPEIIKLEKKVSAGAQFIQTQVIYEPEKFRHFMSLIRHIHVPVLAGIVLLKSATMARFMNKHVAGVFVPDALIDEIERAPDKRAACVEIGARLIREIKGECQGVHVMALGWSDLVPKVLETAGLPEVA